MSEHYITITGYRNYHGDKPFFIGALIRCKKEPENRYDREAICCSLPMIGKVGYVANSVGTVAGGTMSAGRIYDRVPTRFYARVMFTTQTKVICRVEGGCMVQLERELKKQLEERWFEKDGWEEEDDALRF